ncbi:translation initiation factor IF-2-like [Penaeus japonicus]|uniref:translation initiation factor IF-2-like n=1 Tax=Penaeus japonicus TaxID=27405 RepID=UPI001C7102D9|nr:translation initiation factor IF-2-like [Penaeus japonicus]XP_042887058.1 translation initiation factor IF-2-like [Penaeus japonicus]
MKALVLLLSVSCVCWSKPTTVVNFSPVGYSPGIAPGFAYAFRATAPLYAPASSHAGAQAVAPPVAAPTIVKTQYHSQDELGQYAFGYVGDASTAHEVRTLDGAVRGSYTYVDADGKLQTASYVADRNGFRVEATNLPVSPSAPKADLPLPEPVKPTPEVQAATAAHLQAVAEVKAARAKRSVPAQGYLPPPAPAAAHAPAVAQKVQAAPLPAKKVVKVHAAPVAPVVLAPVHTGGAHLAPAPLARPFPLAAQAVFVRADPEVLQRVAALPLVAPAPLAVAPALPAPGLVPAAAPTQILSQFHSQNELGGYEYGYEGGPSTKHEIRTPDGVTRGSYSYVDANGELQTVSYVADDLHGFRVVATNLPEGPADEH